ncbi:extracellular solute-binding protein [Micropruina sp.]|uniref:extracellular solute-binding protein n=1 Tax=Micropruina sp. TaxID=2737536 RepID=UPI0039E47EAE
MKILRLATAAIAVSALGLTACAPPTAGGGGPTADNTSGTLRVWLFSEVNQDPKTEVVNEAIKEFEAAHSGSKVDVQYIPVESRAERFKAAFNDPSSAPDVAEFGNTDLANYVAAGGLGDVTDVIQGWDEGKDLDAKILATTEVGGKKYGIPWFVGVRALYYRTDLLKDAGLSVPTTLDEVEKAARTLREKNSGTLGIAVGGKSQFSAMPYLWAYGGEIATESGGKFTSALTTEASRKGVTAYTNLLKADICPPQTCAEMTGGAAVTAFNAGEAAMTIGGDFNYKSVAESKVKDKFGVVALPGTKAGEIAPAFAGGNNLGIFSKTQNRTLSADFVKILASKKYQEKMFKAMGNLPTFGDVQQQVAKDNAYLKPFVDTLAAGTKFVPVTEHWATIDAQGIFTGMYQKVASGQATVEVATTDAATAMDKVFGS